MQSLWSRPFYKRESDRLCSGNSRLSTLLKNVHKGDTFGRCKFRLFLIFFTRYTYSLQWRVITDHRCSADGPWTQGLQGSRKGPVSLIPPVFKSFPLFQYARNSKEEICCCCRKACLTYRISGFNVKIQQVHRCQFIASRASRDSRSSCSVRLCLSLHGS